MLQEGLLRHISATGDRLITTINPANQNSEIITAIQNSGIVASNQNSGLTTAIQNSGIVTANQNSEILAAIRSNVAAIQKLEAAVKNLG